MKVRQVQRDDLQGLSESLARAFWDDPVTKWFYPDETVREKQLARSFEVRMRAVFLARGATYTVDGLRAGAMWAPPGAWNVTLWELLRMGPLLFPFGRRLGRVMTGLQRLDEVHPREPHWYLAVLGTDPHHQGQGLASALIEQVTVRADRDEIPAYLESSKQENVLFYERHGFKVIAEIGMPEGPPLWCMWRESEA